MPIVKLKVKKSGREQPFELDHAEKILRKSRNWEISDDKYTFKDGSILTKAKTSKKTTKTNETKED